MVHFTPNIQIEQLNTKEFMCCFVFIYIYSIYLREHFTAGLFHGLKKRLKHLSY